MQHWRMALTWIECSSRPLRPRACPESSSATPTLDWLDREQAMRSMLANTLTAVSARDHIHPGVLKYMREIGLLK